MNEAIDLTQGSVAKTLFKFSMPLLAANIVQALYGSVDLYVIGKYCSAQSVAAISTGTQITQIITSVLSGMTLGGTILTAQYIGMKKKEDLNQVIGTTLTLFALFSILLTGIMLASTKILLTLLQTPSHAFDLAQTYVILCSCGIFFICGYNAVSAILRGTGDSFRPLIFICIACIMNCIADVILIKYFNLDVAGAALATVFAQAFSMIASIITLNKQKFVFTFKLSNFRINKSKVKELAALSIPITIQECMVRFSFLTLTSAVNTLGIYASSAVGIASKYDVFAMLPATSLSSALSTFTAQNAAAKKYKRVQSALIFGVFTAFSLSLCFFIWAQFSPQTMIGLFTDDTNIIEVGIPFFKTCSYDYLAVAFVFTLNGFLNGYGKTIFTMISCCSGALFLRIPLIIFVYQNWADNLALLGTVAPLVSFIMAAYTLFYAIKQCKKMNQLT